MKFHDWLISQGTNQELSEEQAVDKLTGDYATYVKEYKRQYYKQDNSSQATNEAANETVAEDAKVTLTEEATNGTETEADNSTVNSSAVVGVVEVNDTTPSSSASILDSLTNASSSSILDSLTKPKNDSNASTSSILDSLTKPKNESETSSYASILESLTKPKSDSSSSSILDSLTKPKNETSPLASLSASTTTSKADELSADDPSCVDSQPDCVGWAEDKQCEANPAFMLESCKKSCHACKKKDDALASSSDADSLAKSLLSNALSSSTPTSASSTSLEDNADCKDDDPGCADWAADNQCKANPDFMLVSCKKSCNSCDKKDSTTDNTAQAAGLVHLIDQGEGLFDYYKERGKSEQQGQQEHLEDASKKEYEQTDSKRDEMTLKAKNGKPISIGWFQKLLSMFQFE